MTKSNASGSGARRGLPPEGSDVPARDQVGSPSNSEASSLASGSRRASDSAPASPDPAPTSGARRGETPAEQLAAQAATKASAKTASNTSATATAQLDSASEPAPRGKRAGKKPMDPAKRRRYRMQNALIILVTLTAIGAILFYQWTILHSAGSMSNAPVWEPGTVVTPPEVPEPDLSALSYNCPTTENVPFIPTTFSIPAKDISMRVLPLGLDASGAAAAPPDNESRLLAWFNLGPKPGSAEGQVLLTGHTFRYSKAIGNELNAGLLTPGDVVVVSDDSGNSACYQFTHDLKIWLADYQDDSRLIYDNYGDPRLAIIVCADWSFAADTSDSRILYYFRLLPPTNAS